MISYHKMFRNVAQMYASLIPYMRVASVTEDSRNGRVWSLPAPILIDIFAPGQRVLLDPVRDANPFFHLFEGLWMLAGRNEVDFVSKFNSRMVEFSDDGATLRGAYGYRWREHFEFDQLRAIVDLLKKDPSTRRAVLSMWDAKEDLADSHLDHPCNMLISFRVYKEELHMTVYNRSNDLIWGLCGANAVHLTMLHEWMAAAVGVKMGTWHHVSNNLHMYEPHWGLNPTKMYEAPAPMPMVKEPWVFLAECKMFCDGEFNPTYYEEPFFLRTVLPMITAWELHKAGETAAAMEKCRVVLAGDWRMATYNWLKRRVK